MRHAFRRHAFGLVTLSFMLIFFAFPTASLGRQQTGEGKGDHTSAAVPVQKSELGAAADGLAVEINRLYDERHIEFQTARHLAFRVQRLRDADEALSKSKTCDGRESRRPFHQQAEDPAAQVRAVVKELDLLVSELFEVKASEPLAARVKTVKNAAAGMASPGVATSQGGELVLRESDFTEANFNNLGDAVQDELIRRIGPFLRWATERRGAASVVSLLSERTGPGVQVVPR